MSDKEEKRPRLEKMVDASEYKKKENSLTRALSVFLPEDVYDLKKDIIHIAVTGAIGVVAFKAGKRRVSKNKSEFDKCIDDIINDILNNAYELYSDKTMGFVGLTGKKLSIKPGELGKLNEVLSKINDQDIPETFTNFILFGPMEE